MNEARKKRLKWIKGLMLFSQAMLLVFTVQWLVSQYEQQRNELKKNITDVFTNVQQEITDSLLWSELIDTSLVNMRSVTYMPRNCGQDTTEKRVTLSSDGVHRILSSARITKSQEKRLFTLDTIVFNELFVGKMKQCGWDFKAEWMNSVDSNTKGRKAIFINSNFFTNENGVAITDYRGYIIWRLVPQVFFVLVLLALSGVAFLLMYRSLREQIKLSELKDDFINNMTHELKTPIATVKIALEALGSFNAIEDPVKGREYLVMASSEMNRLELLATRVLNTSLMETGGIQLHRESYDLQQLVSDVVKAMQLRIEQHGATILFEATGSNFTIPMDKLHLQGVIVNLIDNSLKYGVAPVCIKIVLTEQNGQVQLRHIDNGPGIPEEYREKVFEKFFRVPSGAKHNTRGHGLGLSYAAQVMRRHNGSINVDNMSAGGCVFTLCF